jgi:heat shock protein HslJ
VKDSRVDRDERAVTLVVSRLGRAVRRLLASRVARELYVTALERVAEWRMEGEELVLLDADGVELLRYAAATPVGQWEVAAFLNGDAVSSPLPGTKITASFADDGTLAGSAGCNTYRSTYSTDQGGIDLTAGVDQEGVRRAGGRHGA